MNSKQQQNGLRPRCFAADARPRRCSVVAAALILAALALPARGDDFYKGKTITIAVGAPAGGIYDISARLYARHIGRFIPGNPQTVVQNMPGAAGTRVANFAYNAAPRDGTFLASPLNNLPLAPVMAPAEVKYRIENFNWIGRGDAPSHMLFVWAASGIRTIEDAKSRDILTAVSAPGTATEMYPTLSNNLFGTRFKLVSGYEGSPGANLALERGEVEAVGANSWVNIQVTKPDWVRDKKILPLFLMTLKRDPALPEYPTMLELAKNDEQRGVIGLLARTEEVGFYLLAPPEVPDDRVGILREAFMKMAKDPDYRAEAKSLTFEDNPMHGAELQALATAIATTPDDIVQKFLAAATPKR